VFELFDTASRLSGQPYLPTLEATLRGRTLLETNILLKSAVRDVEREVARLQTQFKATSNFATSGKAKSPLPTRGILKNKGKKTFGPQAQPKRKPKAMSLEEERESLVPKRAQRGTAGSENRLNALALEAKRLIETHIPYALEELNELSSGSCGISDILEDDLASAATLEDKVSILETVLLEIQDVCMSLESESDSQLSGSSEEQDSSQSSIEPETERQTHQQTRDGQVDRPSRSERPSPYDLESQTETDTPQDAVADLRLPIVSQPQSSSQSESEALIFLYHPKLQHEEESKKSSPQGDHKKSPESDPPKDVPEDKVCYWQREIISHELATRHDVVF
jgi:hypothetical protein